MSHEPPYEAPRYPRKAILQSWLHIVVAAVLLGGFLAVVGGLIRWLF